MEKKFRRNMDKCIMGGVCNGIADYTNTDVILWRLLFVLGTIFTIFPFVLTYLIMWIIVPQKTDY